MFINYSNPDNVVIKHDKEIYHGEICYSGPDREYFLYIQRTANDKPFYILNIEDKYKWISNIVGYKVHKDCDFPQVKTREDLIKILDALNEEYDKQFGTSFLDQEFKEGDIVLVRNDLVEGRKYGGVICIDYMMSFKGCYCSIKRISWNGNIILNEDGLELLWSPEMLRKVNPPSDVGYADLRADIGDFSFDQLAPIAVKESSWNQLRAAREAIESTTIAEPTININDFIKEKKHYQLNFNN